MSFGGPIDSMINSYKANVRLLRGRRRLKDIQADYKAKKKPPNMPTTTKKNIREANRFEERIKKQRRADKFRFYVILGLTIVIILVVLAWAITTGYTTG